ncbi:ankyrin repeat and LEM domain-containing protein 1 isoform X2 [Perognathus longimembris pacificus]|uniref:ankyrin repeat and LEM domain-containing protein 1 isoform X2 n=1 Tax=Perognathus longimembris pacificus TaxID=214514 RepID=UPI002018BE9A|nr:ankyrin repeat and LEM domain-containing protein 1 isoform X2 [Perognathus longimembris pacificus]
MDAATRLALQLRAALQEEEPRALEELLRRGANPNLVLSDGVAAVHLAAGARHPRGLRCLEALLRGGGDPNTRSVEALTPLHVAAAWGRCGALELLLSRHADPELRDQDGHRPLDLAVQLGHTDCVRVLREVGLRAPPRAGTPEPEQEPDQLQTQLGRAGSQDAGLEAGPRALILSVPLEVADQDRCSEASLMGWDCSSSASFVTAVEVSGAEDPVQDRTAPWAMSLTQTKQDAAGVSPLRVTNSVGHPLESARAAMTGQETELSANLWALTLTSAEDTAFQPPCCVPALPDASPAHSPLQGPLPGSNFQFSQDDQTSFDEDVAARWLTEDEERAPGGQDSAHSCQPQPVSAMPDLELLRALRALGTRPGPITPFTRPHYLRRLEEARAASGPDFSGHSPELAEALRTGCVLDSQADEDSLAQQFERPDPTKRWRKGTVKSSFTYLLLDPRETRDLPARAFSLTPAERLQTFVRAIFYVGKGTRARPDVHLWEALGYWGQPRKQACPKVRQILDIWDSGRGVVSLHCFQHVVAVEAYTREACLLDALGIQRLTNQKQGHYYGVVASWSPARRRRLGVHLLHRALLIFLAEGERELRPQDIQRYG